MVFISSAILGAATGTGLALMVAMMIVVYRYYVYRKKGAEWEELDRLEEKRNARKIQLQVSEAGHLAAVFAKQLLWQGTIMRATSGYERAFERLLKKRRTAKKALYLSK